jgi:uncharacterized membrane protein YtjA (UPF0391 family)
MRAHPQGRHRRRERHAFRERWSVRPALRVAGRERRAFRTMGRAGSCVLPVPSPTAPPRRARRAARKSAKNRPLSTRRRIAAVWHATCVLSGRHANGGLSFPHWRNPMLYYAVIFLVIALVAGVLGFGGIAGASVGIAKILFFVFLILFVVSLIMGRRVRT